jgi:protein subunit release factor A
MYGEKLIMEKELAVDIRERAISAIEALHQALVESAGRCSEEEYISIRHGVGSSIATIHTDLLEQIYKQYPELNHITK